MVDIGKTKKKTTNKQTKKQRLVTKGYNNKHRFPIVGSKDDNQYLSAWAIPYTVSAGRRVVANRLIAFSKSWLPTPQRRYNDRMPTDAQSSVVRGLYELAVGRHRRARAQEKSQGTALWVVRVQEEQAQLLQKHGWSVRGSSENGLRSDGGFRQFWTKMRTIGKTISQQTTHQCKVAAVMHGFPSAVGHRVALGVLSDESRQRGRTPTAMDVGFFSFSFRVRYRALATLISRPVPRCGCYIHKQHSCVIVRAALLWSVFSPPIEFFI